MGLERRVKPHLALGDGVVDVNGGEEEGSGLLHLVEPLDTGGGPRGAADEPLLHLAVLAGVGLEAVADDGENDLELGVVGGVRVGDLAGLLELLLGLDTLVDEQRGVTAVVDDEVLHLVLPPRRGLLHGERHSSSGGG
uniref:Uncharacterized protein n=1 Tax=Oryza brachyantha TaxID=4533 RepID=J3N864_ORYBR